MKKILISLFLCITFLLNFSSAYAYDYTPYVGDGTISATPVLVDFEKITVVEGDLTETTVVDEIGQATQISASCMVKPGSDFENNIKVVIIIAGYKGKCLVSYKASESVTFTSSLDSAKKVSATLLKGSQDIDGIKVFLWDSVDNARPLANYGNVSESKNTIEAILVGGEVVEIDENTKSGEIEVNAGYMEWPDIVVFTDSITTPVKVDVKGAFPLSKPDHCFIDSNTEVPGTSEIATAIITVGNDKYTINVTQAVPQITGVKFREFKSTMNSGDVTYYNNTQVKVQYDMRNPIWTDEIPGPHVEITGKTADSSIDNINKYYSGVKTLENISPAYSNTTTNPTQNTMFYFDIAPEMIGAQCFTVPWISETLTTMIDNVYTFTIDRSARIYIRNSNETLDDTWTRAINRFQSKEAMQKCMYYEFRAGATGNSVQFGTGNTLYYKDYYVKPGETCTISLPTDKSSPRIFVKYMDNKFVTNATYTKSGEKIATQTTGVYKPYFVDPELTTNKYKFYGNNNSTSTASVYGTGNLMYSTATFLDEGTTNRRGNSLVVVPDEIVGATALVTPFQMSNVSKVEFDVNTSVRVYMFTTTLAPVALKKNLGEGWNYTNFTHDNEEYNNKNLAIAYRGNDSVINEKITNETSFYKDFIVQPDDVRHISIDIHPTYMSGQKAVFVIKPLEE